MPPRQNERYHHGNLRTALVDAATELLRDEGNAALTLRAAARRAGVSQAAPYKHFSDKRDLLAAVAERGFAMLHRRCEHAAAPDDPEQLHKLGEAYVLFALDEPALFRLMFSAELGALDEHPGLAATASATHGLMEQAVRNVLGERTDRQAVESACAGTWSLVHGLAFLLLEDRIRLPTGGRTALIHQVTGDFVLQLRTGGEKAPTPP